MTASNSNVCVTFDLWETLIFDEPEGDMTRSRLRYEGLHSVLADLGVQLPLDSLRRAYEDSAPRLQAIWRRNDDLPTIEQIRMIIELASGQPTVIPPYPGSVEMLENAYVDPVFAYPPKLNDEALTTLERLRSRGHKIGLISNTGRTPGKALRRLLEKYGVLHFFDATVFSNEVGFRKPDKRIYEQAANLLRADLRDIVHVGDDPEADYWGAKQSGMRAVLFEGKIPALEKWRPSSLFVLNRMDRHLPDSEIKPDGRVSSLSGALDIIKSLT